MPSLCRCPYGGRAREAAASKPRSRWLEVARCRVLYDEECQVARCKMRCSRVLEDVGRRAQQVSLPVCCRVQGAERCRVSGYEVQRRRMALGARCKMRCRVLEDVGCRVQGMQG